MNEFTQEKWSYGHRDRIIDRNEEKAREDEIGEEREEKRERRMIVRER